MILNPVIKETKIKSANLFQRNVRMLLMLSLWLMEKRISTFILWNRELISVSTDLSEHKSKIKDL
jgi:hypothetical protein